MILYLDRNPVRGRFRNEIKGTTLKIVSTQKLPSGLWKVEVEE